MWPNTDIFSGGGAKTGEDGGTEQVKDQKADNPTVKAIMRNMKKNIAFAVIAGKFPHKSLKYLD